jgi:hypothetical protein
LNKAVRHFEQLTYLRWVQYDPISQVFVNHVFLTELQVQVFCALVFLVEDGPVDFWETIVATRPLLFLLVCFASHIYLLGVST